MIGLHIISDLKNVSFSKIDLNEKVLKKLITNNLKSIGLSELGSYYHTFGNNNELTCIVALAESHISIHTWPEKEYISLDIFVCNLGEDNTQKAKKLYKELLEFFKPGDINEMFIDRKSN